MKIRNFHSGPIRKSLWKKFLEKFFGRQESGMSWKKKILIGIGGMIALVFLYATIFLPAVDDESAQLIFSESSIIYDRGALDPNEDPVNHILYVIHGDENRDFIPLKDISPWVAKATVAIEDDNFYHHWGFDVGGIIKAVLNKLFGIGSARGGSTITQQLVKNAFLSREQTMTRKFNELLLSMKMEFHYPKDKILEMYLNKIPYGNNAHGIEAAAQTFFGKSARDLTLAESVVLASLPVAPTKFNPYGPNKDLLMGYYDYKKTDASDTTQDKTEEDEKTGSPMQYHKGRKDLVLQRMLDLNMITFDEFKQAFSEAKDLKFIQNKTDIKAPHFVFNVRQQLEDKYGKEFLLNGGLRIYTTLDPDLQKLAEETIAVKSAPFPSTYGAKNVALAAVNPDNGEVLAYVGGRDYFDSENDGQFDVLTSRRQPGSSFKPLVYASAFEKGYSPGTVVFDVETDFGGNYKPQNYYGTFAGPVSAREALNRSLNIPAIKMAYLATPQKVFENAQKIGVKIDGTPDEHGVAIGIGVAEVEPLSFINSYQVFARDGTWYDPTTILEIRNSAGKVLEKFDSTKTKHEGINPEAAALVRNILTDESTRPTIDDFNWNNLLQLDGIDDGVKTGTSNRDIPNPNFDPKKPEDEKDNSKTISVPNDAWTIGFTPSLVSGVWVGNNRGEPMNRDASGMSVAAPIWKKFMTDANAILIKKGTPKDKEYPEVKLETRKINKFSGKLATDQTPPKLVQEEVFASYSVPTELDESVKQVEVDKVSGLRSTRYTPLYARRQMYTLDLKDVRPDLPNWNAPVQEWLKKHPRFLSSMGTIHDDEDDGIFGEGFSESRFARLALLRASDPNAQIPGVQDDVHNSYTQSNPPQIKITSPKKNGTIAPGTIDISVAASGKFGVREVEFYFDDQMVAFTSTAPFTGQINIPAATDPGSKHVIKAIAIDELFHTAEDAIEVKISPDEAGPEVSFLGPVANQQIPIGAHVKVLAGVQDFESSLKVVEFLLDGKSLGYAQAAPFEKSFTASGDLGNHELTIQAWDVHGNMTKKKISVVFVAEQALRSSDPEITKITPYKTSVSVDIVIPSPEKIEWIELTAIQNNEPIFMEQLKSPLPKFAEFQIAKNYLGNAQLQLTVKKKGEEKEKVTSNKTTEL